MPVYKTVNKDFFKTWTPEMSYVLGFFFAHGSYDINPRGSEYFSLQITDRLLLLQIQSVLQSNHKISVRKPRNIQESTQYRLQIGSKEMCADLRKYGICQKKAHTVKFPTVPKKYVASFIRGYFDGDGNVWSGAIHKDRKKQQQTLLAAFTSCSDKFLLGVQAILVEYGLGRGSLFKTQTAYRLQYSAKDSIILSNLMYRDVCKGLLLERKKKVFQKFIESKKCGM